jgi:phosphate transport system protein
MNVSAHNNEKKTNRKQSKTMAIASPMMGITANENFPRTRSHFEEQLKGLLTEMVVMAVSCSEMLHRAIGVLSSQDLTEVNAILYQDDGVDVQEQEIEAKVLRLLALQQPVLASDLRFVSMVLKAITDLERIGDHCVNIAKVAQKMVNDGVIYQPLVDIHKMEHLIGIMLDDTIHALVRKDAELARIVILADKEVDALYQQMQRQLRATMLSGDTGMVVRASHLLFVIHYLERIGDHCVGIAERLLFAETGHSIAAQN